MLDRLDGVAHGADWLRQAGGQAACQQKSEEQGKQRQDPGLEHDLLLPLAEGIVGHADNHPSQIIFGSARGGGRALQEVIVEPDPLQAHRGLKHLDLLWAPFAGIGLLDVHQHIVGAVLYLQKAYMRGGQGRFHQAFEYFPVAGNHPVLGGRGQLVGDQLPGVVELLAQVLDPHEGKEADQQQRQQQGRAQADDLRAGMNVPVQTTPHGLRSPSASASAAPSGSMVPMPRARATCWLPTTLKCSGYRARGHLPGA
ncbi:hypothetical protein D3C80_626560 [compost metagenome]